MGIVEVLVAFILKLLAIGVFGAGITLGIILVYLWIKVAREIGAKNFAKIIGLFMATTIGSGVIHILLTRL